MDGPGSCANGRGKQLGWSKAAHGRKEREKGDRAEKKILEFSLFALLMAAENGMGERKNSLTENVSSKPAWVHDGVCFENSGKEKTCSLTIFLISFLVLPKCT